MSSKDSHDVWRAIRSQPIAMMTTEHDGKLVSRPMATHADEEHRRIFFIARLESEASHDVDHGAAINLGYVDSGDNTYVSVSGRGTLSQDRAKLHELWSPWAQAWLPQGPDGADVALIAVTPEEATIWDATSSKLIATVKTFAANLTGKQPDTGQVDHVKL